MRKAILVSIILVAMACLWFPLRGKLQHRLTLRAFFSHAQGVRVGMPVCVDGVEVGSVGGVTVRPELGDRPVEVVLTLHTPYQLRIPGDSTAQLGQQGVFRPTLVDIDTRAAHGPPIADGGTIQGRESTDDQAAHALGVVVKALVEQSKAGQDGEQLPSKLKKPKR